MTTNKSKHQSQDLNLDGYQSLNFEGLARHANYRVIAYREDILHILDKKDAAAIIFQVIYRWLTEKRREDILSEMDQRHKTGQPQLTPQDVEDRMWVYMSYNDFARESGGAIGYNTVVRTLEYLIQKGIIERRENSNPKFTEYEYRVNKETVRDLLKELPTFPYYRAKGANGKETATPHTQMGSGTPYPNGVGGYPNGADPHTQMGLGDTQMGLTPYPNGSTSQKKTQNSPQSSSQEITQKQESADVSSSQSAASPNLILGNLSLEEIAIIQEYRRKTTETTPPPLEKLPQAHQLVPESKQAANGAPASDEKVTDRPERPNSASALTEEIVIQLWEYLRGVRYEDKQERAAQARAVRTLLGLRLPIPLSIDMLERVYNTYLDDFWRNKYGDLHLTHLIDTERSTGQRRIIRWLNRLRSQPVVAPVVKTSENTEKPQDEEPTSEKDAYVLWTRDTDNPALKEFVNTPRGKRWYDLAALITWEGMTEAEAMQYGWELGNLMTDHEIRMIAHAQQRRESQHEVEEVHA